MSLSVDNWREIAKHCDFKTLKLLALLCRDIYRIAFPIILGRSLISDYIVLRHLSGQVANNVEILVSDATVSRIAGFTTWLHGYPPGLPNNSVVSYVLSGNLASIYNLYGIENAIEYLTGDLQHMSSRIPYSGIKYLMKTIPQLREYLSDVGAITLYREGIITKDDVKNKWLLLCKPEFMDWMVRVVSKAANRQGMEYYESAYCYHISPEGYRVMQYGDYESIMQNLHRLDANLIKNGILSEEEFNRIVATACYRGIPIPDKNLFRYKPTFADIQDCGLFNISYESN